MFFQTIRSVKINVCSELTIVHELVFCFWNVLFVLCCCHLGRGEGHVIFGNHGAVSDFRNSFVWKSYSCSREPKRVADTLVHCVGEHLRCIIFFKGE